MSNLPKQLSYPNVQPYGLTASESLLAKLSPQGALPPVITGSEWVTWQFQDDSAFMDPYSLYVKFDVQITDQATFPPNSYGSTAQPQFDGADKLIMSDSVSVDHSTNSNCGFHLVPNWADGTCKQLDGSAQSLITELVINSNSETIQRIYDYDMMAHIYRVLGYKPWERLQRKHEGMGGYDCEYLANQKCFKSTASQPTASTAIYNSVSLPTGSTTFTNGIQNITKGRFQSVLDNHAADQITNTRSPVIYPTRYYKPGAVDNEVAYTTNPNSLGFVTEPTANTWDEAGFINSSLQSTNYTTRALVGGIYDFTPQAPYFQNAITTCCFANNSTFDPTTPNQSQLLNIMNYPKFSGYECPYSTAFCYSGFEPMLSLNIPQKFIKYGYPEQKYRVWSDSYYVPLICILGIEWQPEDYYLLPMWSFGRCDIQIRFNRNAFFTSHPLETRKYQITKAELNFDVYKFSDELTASVKNLTNGGGISLHHTTFKRVILDESRANSLRQTYTITEGVFSAKFLLCYWIPKDYETYSNCRKAFFVNPCLCEYFVSLGNRVYPPKTIVGSATNRGTDNCSDMYIASMKCFGKAWMTPDHHMSVANFALCNRLWDPSAQVGNENLTLGVDVKPVTKTTAPTKSSVPTDECCTMKIPNCSSAANCKLYNTGTCGSQSIYNENAVTGSGCILGIDFETFNREGGIMSGIDTRKYGSFQLNLKQKFTDGNIDTSDRPIGYADNTTLQMYGWLYIDQIVDLMNNKITIRS